jgi:molybdate transport system substrate-binding protein
LAAEIKVLSSIATREAYNELVPQFEKSSGHTVITTWAGTTAIMQKMAAGERHDLIIISGTEIDELIRQGKIVADSRVNVARCGIGIAIRAGSPKPNVSSADALKRALLAAKTVGYTSGPSGIYMGKLIERMGIADQIKPKFRSVPSGGTIGTIVASGDCEIGFQQVSEIVHIPGVDFAGPLPPEVQHVTVFCCGVQTGSTNDVAARSLASFLSSAGAAAVMKKHGLEPG